MHALQALPVLVHGGFALDMAAGRKLPGLAAPEEGTSQVGVSRMHPIGAAAAPSHQVGSVPLHYAHAVPQYHVWVFMEAGKSALHDDKAGIIPVGAILRLYT